MDTAATMATPHLLMKLDKQNMAKTSFKLPASDSVEMSVQQSVL
jgi:hypothetical protein